MAVLQVVQHDRMISRAPARFAHVGSDISCATCHERRQFRYVEFQTSTTNYPHRRFPHMPSVPNPWRTARPVLCRGASKRSQSWASPKRQRLASEGCAKNCDLLNRRNPAGSAISSGVLVVDFRVQADQPEQSSLSSTTPVRRGPICGKLSRPSPISRPIRSCAP